MADYLGIGSKDYGKEGYAGIGSTTFGSKGYTGKEYSGNGYDLIGRSDSGTMLEKQNRAEDTGGIGIDAKISAGLNLASGAVSTFSQIGMSRFDAENKLNKIALQQEGDAALSKENDLNRVEQARQANVENDFKRQAMEIDNAKNSYYERMESAKKELENLVSGVIKQNERAARITGDNMSPEEKQALIKASSEYNL
jgi:hypothetical protein